jgi:glycosyltransferase involved in cell wall biosynthesis
MALRGADAVWFTSAHERALLAPTGVSGQLLPNGVDIAPFRQVVRAPEEGRWLVFGRIDVHKGLDLLLDRLAAVASHDPRPFQVRVVGAESRPGLIAALLEKARKLGLRHRVRFLGPATPADLAAEMARCEFALFPSRAEAFGVAVVEAQAAGVPVVVQDIPPFRELVSDGVDGFVVDFRGGDGSRRLRLLRGHAQSVSAPAREASLRHAWDTKVVQWEAEYTALVRP